MEEGSKVLPDLPTEIWIVLAAEARQARSDREKVTGSLMANYGVQGAMKQGCDDAVWARGQT